MRTLIKPMNMHASESRAFVDKTLTDIKSWPDSRRFYNFWKPTYKRYGNILLSRDSDIYEIPSELKRCILTLGESSINRCIFLHAPRRKSELREEIIFGHLFDGRFLIFNPSSETPEHIYVLSGKNNNLLLASESLAPLLAWAGKGLKRKVRRGVFYY